MKTDLAFAVARRRITPTLGTEQHQSQGNYGAWREKMLEQEYRSAFDVGLIAGKDVLDFGCGSGELAFLLHRLGAKSVLGIDLSEQAISIAKSRMSDESIRFVLATQDTRVEVPDSLVDVVACFDVMEHIMEPTPVIREWYRVLRPGGCVLIHWQPWWHPWGHHARVYLPIPWAHAFLSNVERLEVCARVMDLAEIDPPYWDRRDGKKVNRFREELERGEGGKSSFLNGLTMGGFEKLATAVGFKIKHRHFENFNGPWPVRAASAMLNKLPVVREFFTANAVYVLGK